MKKSKELVDTIAEWRDMYVKSCENLPPSMKHELMALKFYAKRGHAVDSFVEIVIKHKPTLGSITAARHFLTKLQDIKKMVEDMA